MDLARRGWPKCCISRTRPEPTAGARRQQPGRLLDHAAEEQPQAIGDQRLAQAYGGHFQAALPGVQLGY